MDRNVNWKEVEHYLKRYIGEFFEIADTKDVIFLGDDLPDEYSYSNYTHRLKGASAKAKANAVQGLPEMIEIAMGGLPAATTFSYGVRSKCAHLSERCYCSQSCKKRSSVNSNSLRDAQKLQKTQFRAIQLGIFTQNARENTSRDNGCVQ